MSQSLLITGGNTKIRTEKALELAQSSSAKFDILEIETEQEHGIALVKDVNNQLARKPFQSKVLTLIIKEADNLTVEAQNSLLKTLEEPPESAQVILTASSKENLLSTVTSRCLEIALNPFPRNQKLGKETPEDRGFGWGLEKMEKTDLNESLVFWEEKLKESILEGKPSSYIRKIHRNNKILLKLSKASKSSANKKLLALILALELNG